MLLWMPCFHLILSKMLVPGGHIFIKRKHHYVGTFTHFVEFSDETRSICLEFQTINVGKKLWHIRSNLPGWQDMIIHSPACSLQIVATLVRAKCGKIFTLGSVWQQNFNKCECYMWSFGKNLTYSDAHCQKMVALIPLGMGRRLTM